MAIASGNCTITATGDALSLLKKESESFSSHEIEAELDNIGSIVIGNTLNLGGTHFKVDKIKGNKVYGHTIIQPLTVEVK